MCNSHDHANQEMNECCGGGCGCCGSKEELNHEEVSAADEYALIGQEAYEELIKEKIKKKFLENESELDQIADISYRCTQLYWKELKTGEYDEEKWNKLNEELSKVWEK